MEQINKNKDLQRKEIRSIKNIEEAIQASIENGALNKAEGREITKRLKKEWSEVNEETMNKLRNLALSQWWEGLVSIIDKHKNEQIQEETAEETVFGDDFRQSINDKNINININIPTYWFADPKWLSPDEIQKRVDEIPLNTTTIYKWQTQEQELLIPTQKSAPKETWSRVIVAEWKSDSWDIRRIIDLDTLVSNEVKWKWEEESIKINWKWKKLAWEIKWKDFIKRTISPVDKKKHPFWTINGVDTRVFEKEQAENIGGKNTQSDTIDVAIVETPVDAQKSREKKLEDWKKKKNLKMMLLNNMTNIMN